MRVHGRLHGQVAAQIGAPGVATYHAARVRVSAAAATHSQSRAVASTLATRVSGLVSAIQNLLNTIANLARTGGGAFGVLASMHLSLLTLLAGLVLLGLGAATRAVTWATRQA